MDRPDLYELADRAAPEEAHVAVAGDFTGVALPDRLGAAVLASEEARKLGAQLILAADEHDAIFERGVAEFERHQTLAEHGTRRMAEANAERAERRSHEIADALAQRVLGCSDPYPGEPPEAYRVRSEAEEARFKEQFPEWQPERFNRRSS